MDGHADQTAIYRHGFSFSGRDLIMLFGGIFLLFKQQPNCMNGWKTAIMIPATVKLRQFLGGRHTDCHP